MQLGPCQPAGLLHIALEAGAAWPTKPQVHDAIGSAARQDASMGLSSSSGRERPRLPMLMWQARAGLSCARQLRAKGFEVVVLEGNARPGGRVHSLKLQVQLTLPKLALLGTRAALPASEMHAGCHAHGCTAGAAALWHLTMTLAQAGKCSAAADLGGSIITGIDGNPLAVLAAQLGIPLHNIGSDCELYLPDGSQPPAALDKQVLHRAQDLSSADRRARSPQI